MISSTTYIDEYIANYKGELQDVADILRVSPGRCNNPIGNIARSPIA